MTGRPREKRTPRSEGVRLLERCGKSQAEIAAACGSAQPTVARWMTGEKVPGDAAQLRLEQGLGISRAAWTQPPATGKRPRASTVAAHAPATVAGMEGASRPRMGRLEALAHQRKVASHANELLGKLMTDAEESNTREQAEAMKAASTANACLGRLESMQKKNMLAILESEDWRRIQHRLTEVLVVLSRQYPDAGKEFAELLSRAMDELGAEMEAEEA